eukprot:scaffold82339_cov63-Cyclotella_meneghiniana.AAC.5
MSACPKTDGYRGLYTQAQSDSVYKCFCQYDDGTNPAVNTDFPQMRDYYEGTGPMYGTTGYGSYTCHKWHPATSGTGGTTGTGGTAATVGTTTAY